MKHLFLIPAFLCLLVSTTNLKAQLKEPVTFKNAIPIYTNASQNDPLYKAIRALSKDIEKITGKAAVIKPAAVIDKSGIVINNAAQTLTLKPVNGWEAHHLYTTTVNNVPCVLLEGADLRGTIYAVYTFCEKILGVPPLWFYSNWQPVQTAAVTVPAGFDIRVTSPSVKYRAWFPNDTDLFSPWRKLSAENNEIWLETALRLKMNTIEWHDEGERKKDPAYALSPTTLLIHQYGLINTTHHHSPLNASFARWQQYWEQIRDTVAPALSLANESRLVEFWRYNIEAVKRAGVDMIWVIGFRGAGDHPFWYTFKDAPAGRKERGEVISRMIQKQFDLVVEIMGSTPQQFRTIFYDELSDLLAEGHLKLPTDDQLIWNFVAARRDHYPNLDLQRMEKGSNRNLGYYFNCQFTSTGSHLVAGEGPWKMEQNYRYVAQRSRKPLLFSVVNAGNIREFVMELSANAAMMWNTDGYNSTRFVQDFCKLYYAPEQAAEIAGLYGQYYQAFWKQRKPDLPSIDRQYIFQDLRYKRAISEIVKAIQKNQYTGQPLTDHEGEQLPGRTYRIVPADNNAASVLEAVEKGTTVAAAKFEKVAAACDKLVQKNDISFLNDNLGVPAWFMFHLNKALQQASLAYRIPAQRQYHISQTLQALQQAESKLQTMQYGAFNKWYTNDRIFGLQQLIAAVHAISTPDANTKNSTK